MGTNTNDPVEVARQLIIEALFSHIKGKNREERLHKATADVVDAVVHLIKTAPVSQKGKLGATVMTESASTRNPSTGKFNMPPRTI